jgi:hypothetical protein
LAVRFTDRIITVDVFETPPLPEATVRIFPIGGYLPSSLSGYRE